MPSRSFYSHIDKLISDLLILQKEGFYYKSAMPSTNRDDLARAMEPETANFWNAGNNKIHIYRQDLVVECDQISSFNNIHQGLMFSRSSSDGGFYLVLDYFVDQQKVVSGDIGYSTMFKIEGEWRDPPIELKEARDHIFKTINKRRSKPK